MVKIAHIENSFTEKFGIPRQSGLVNDLRGRIVFEPEYRNADALRGLEDFSHIWIIWEFSEAIRRGKADAEGNSKGETGEPAQPASTWRPTVRPPRLGGNERLGVFATRSPFRPNPIGLSCVEIDHIEFNSPDGPVIVVRGADLMNGTPIFDIKPYIPYADCKPEATGGFTDSAARRHVEVIIPEELKRALKPVDMEGLVGILKEDPRPAFHTDADRVYTFTYANKEVSFTCDGELLRVVNIK